MDLKLSPAEEDALFGEYHLDPSTHLKSIASHLTSIPTDSRHTEPSRGPNAMTMLVVGTPEDANLANGTAKLTVEQLRGTLTLKMRGASYLFEYGLASGGHVDIRALVIRAAIPGNPVIVEARWNGRSMAMSMNGIEDATMGEVERARGIVSSLKLLLRTGRPTGPTLLKNLTLGELRTKYQQYIDEQAEAPGLPDVAVMLGVSKRTLERKIQAEGWPWPPG